MSRWWLVMGCFFCFMSVATGAFAAHALKEILDPRSFEIFQLASRYMMFHGLALLALGLWTKWDRFASNFITGTCFVLGVSLFSGSLFAFALTGAGYLVMITPAGGVLLLIAWALFAWKALTSDTGVL